ncbi:MAG TPA: hypothetical protein VFI47_19845 [Acidimicrobiales bacterium]|nr:hypothetical protein [Acidimicrobiales bacterium]
MRALAALAAVGALALGACGGGGDGTAAEGVEDALGGIDSGDAVTTTEEAPAREPELTPVDLDLPREVTYGAAVWAVDEVTYRSGGTDELGIELPPAVIVGFTVANTGEGAVDLDVTGDALSLLDADAFRIAPDDENPGLTGTVAAGGRSDFEVVFGLEDEIEPDDLADYTVEIGSEGFEPAPVPLGGTQPVPAYPVTVTMPASVDGLVLSSVSGQRGAATLRSIQGTVTLDHGPERAPEGSRFLTVNGEVAFFEGSQNYLDEDDLGVAIDGLVVEQEAATTPPGATDLPAGSTVAATWTFVIPETGTAGVLRFGKDAEAQAKGGEFSLPPLP